MCTFKKGPKMRFIKPLSPCYKVRHVKDDDVILKTTHDYKIAASGKKMIPKHLLFFHILIVFVAF